ncbi:flagellar hook-length control protein FliK [Sphingomonas dokdonensis]|uniref:Flagellar hook-length control protein FliK n=1 Tax=Sphingomonas dokdonensis TaxID=344880 RepID=A0A245ZNE2_9SPHN|nr:flagellar hook-length control protein FliK [Sphingomonas dokdonensis]OWK31255.1 flagellar hook-length control protein FliK [Sphingomonas dokdonensis]
MMPTLTSFTDTLAAGHPGGAPGKAAPRKGQVAPLPGHVAPVTPRQPGAHGESGFAALLTGPVAPVMPQQPGVVIDNGLAPRLPGFVAPVMPQQPGVTTEQGLAPHFPASVTPVMSQQPGTAGGNDPAVSLTGIVAPVMPRQPGEDGDDDGAALVPGPVAPVMPRQPGAAGGERGVVLLPGNLAPVSPRQDDGEGGNGLPASPGKDDDGSDVVQPGGWIAPPTWLVTCPPPAPVSAGAQPTITSAIPLAVAAGASAAGEGEVTLSAPVGAAPEGAAVLTPAAGLPPLAPGTTPSNGFPAQQPVGAMPASSQNVAAPAFSLAPPAAPDGGPAPTQLSVTPNIAAQAQPASGAPALSVGAEANGQGKPDRAEAIAMNHLPPSVKAPVQVELPVQVRQVAPAAQMFAAAIHRAARDERRGEASDAMIAGLAPTAELTPQAAVEQSRHAALDMARATWPAKMIERIEMMRDALDAADTSIRLVPDKLGTIDVSLRREGDGVAVHFNAQQAETRQLLADAQPKLAELAEAKGLKLSAQAGGDPSQQQQQQQSQGQRAPASVPLSSHRYSQPASSDAVGVADERIA